MINLIERKLVFEKYKNITAEIAEMQRAFFYYDDANNLDIIYYNDLFDIKETYLDEIEKFYKVISFEHNNINTFPQQLALKLVGLLAALNVNEVIIISHLRMGLIGNQKSNHPLLKELFIKFQQITGDLEYKGAIQTNLESLPQLLEIIFWIGRYDTSAPEFIFFHDKDEKIAFYLCKDGNVHTIAFKHNILSEKMLIKYDWKFVNGQCFNKFSNSNKIEGRKSNR